MADQASETTGVYRVGDLRVDLGRQRVTRDGEALVLTDLSFHLLRCLVLAEAHPVDAHSLARQVWGFDHVSDETIAQRVTLLRKALGDDPRQPRYIRTVRGRGYALMQPAIARRDIARWMSMAGWPLRQGWGRPAIAASGLAILVAALVWLPSQAVRSPAGAGVPSMSDTLVERARAQMRLHQAAETDTAITLLREALALSPNDPEARLALSFALSTRATKFAPMETDKQEAEALARGLLAEGKQGARQGTAWHALGYALDAQGRVEEALAAYTHAYETDPDDYAAMSSAAYLLLVRGRFHDALSLEARAMQAGQVSLYADIQIAQSLALTGMPVAADWQTRAQQLNPGQVVIIGELARQRLREGDVAGALAMLDTASEDDRQLPRLMRLRGRALAQTGNWDAAADAWNAAGEAALHDRAALAALNGDDEMARMALDEGRQQMLAGDSWPGMRVKLAEIEAALGNEQAALSLLGQAVDLGWRDTASLAMSPFLKTRVDLGDIADRIDREIAAQRRLIEAEDALETILHPVS